MLGYILTLVFKLIDFYSILILISVVASWIDPRKDMQIFNMIRKITDPYLNLFKIVIPIGNMGIDISPIIAISLLNLLKNIIVRFYYII